MSGAAAIIPKIFLLGSFLGAIGCLSRADYNLPIFLFAYIAWNYLNVSFRFNLNLFSPILITFLQRQQVYVILLFVFSLIVDIIWYFFIVRKVWGSDDYIHLAPWETKLHSTVNWVAGINFVLKVRNILNDHESDT